MQREKKYQDYHVRVTCKKKSKISQCHNKTFLNYSPFVKNEKRVRSQRKLPLILAI